MENKGIKCPITGNNISSIIFCTVAGFVYIFGLDYLVHVKWLSGIYAQTSQLWRTAEEMGQNFYFMQLINLVIAFTAAELYGRFANKMSVGEGIRFGIVLGLLLGAIYAAPYAWLPISGVLAIKWFISGLAKGLGLGILYSLIYRP